MRACALHLALLVVSLAVPPQEAAQTPDPLAAALEVARWLEHVAIETPDGLTWPVQIEGEPRTSLALYDGAPGVVLFFLEAHQQTGDAHWLELARAGADDLLARLDQAQDLPAGLYVGLAGLGFTFIEVWETGDDERYRAAAERCFARLREAALENDEGVRWNDTTDVISGSAGIGLALLRAHRSLEDTSALELARRAGDELIARGVAEHDGLRWAMSADYPRRMPNFSHGTAGIGHFLVELQRATGEARFSGAATRAAIYLGRIADPQGDGALILHSEPGNEELYYLSWCHGPPGTARFLRALSASTRDDTWRALANGLVTGVLESGAPETRTPGLWNNVGACCGDAGVADLLLALSRVDADRERAGQARRFLAHVLAESTVDATGRRWTHAEHRLRPGELTTQTGAMQGAAGIGLVLLRAHAAAAGGAPRVTFPDDPWPALERERER